MNAVGYFYLTGIGVKEDAQIAMDWYVKAMEGGNATAHYNAGDLYESGRGVAVNLKKAFELYKKSAELGSANGMFALGRMYDGVFFNPDNDAEALKWYLKAVDAGYKGASSTLAWLYDELYQSDKAAGYILKTVSEGDTYRRDQLKQFNGLTLRALKKKLRTEGVYKGGLSGAVDRRLEKALIDYASRKVAAKQN
jgi:uncharacterized protein